MSGARDNHGWAMVTVACGESVAKPLKAEIAGVHTLICTHTHTKPQSVETGIDMTELQFAFRDKQWSLPAGSQSQRVKGISEKGLRKAGAPAAWRGLVLIQPPGKLLKVKCPLSFS